MPRLKRGCRKRNKLLITLSLIPLSVLAVLWVVFLILLIPLPIPFGNFWICTSLLIILIILGLVIHRLSCVLRP